MCDPENFVAQEREEARWAYRRGGHLAAAVAELPDGPTRQELRREGRELEEDLRRRRGAR